MNNNLFFVLIIPFLFSCNTTKEDHDVYENQIGDTSFDSTLDDPKFQFCDSTKVLHKRARISYSGGKKNLEESLTKAYNFKPEYSSFSGYFIVRLAVNCKNEAGRFRLQILDNDFNLTEYPESLKLHIKTIFKELSEWNHAVYENEYYDCYTFHTIKINNGKIETLW